MFFVSAAISLAIVILIQIWLVISFLVLCSTFLRFVSVLMSCKSYIQDMLNQPPPAQPMNAYGGYNNAGYNCYNQGLNGYNNGAYGGYMVCSNYALEK